MYELLLVFKLKFTQKSRYLNHLGTYYDTLCILQNIQTY